MKTFLSIGSGPGIGTATAERFAREGYRVVLTSRDPAKLAGRVAQLESNGYTVAAKAVDAGDLASISTLIKETEAEFGAINVLHFNSASMHSATIETQPADTFVPDLTVNIGAPLVAIQDVSRGMLQRGEGTILLTGGMFGVTPHPDYLSLSIGKAGIRSLTHGLFDSFKDRGVHVAMVNVATLVAPDSPEAHGIAEAFWNLHAEPQATWSADVTYPA
ncbi:SDR family NAD(P)-dependent oxidoreductase [Rhizobium sp. 2YAF20]|uniref:SDR family NAD(P)-dependent oxidoreductase n=1 Tax=Rhizobium sp. 2YAF20 TaxID=3233027 RepID=UPI003F9D03D0